MKASKRNLSESNSSTTSDESEGESQFATDTSDEDDVQNTVGDIDIEWYKDHDHIGYDRDGNKIMKPKDSMGGAIDDFLAQCDDPNYFRTVCDKLTGQRVVLSDNEVDLINRIRSSEYPDPEYDPYAPWVDYFSSEVSLHPVQNRPEPKAAFIPSLSEKRAITKLVRLIKSGKADFVKPKAKIEPFKFTYDLWHKGNDSNNRRHRGHIAVPKQGPPGHAESYNPPPEYLITSDDVKKWESMTEEERDTFFLPERFSNIRSIPFYKHTIRERFERCIELYLCPRQRKRRANVDPESLIPKLPKPADLQPFPSAQAIVYKGHQDIVRSISVEPRGQFMVSGSDDKTAKIWEITTGRCWKTIEFDDRVNRVAWCPNTRLCLIAITLGKHVIIVNPNVGDPEISSETDSMFTSFDETNNEKQEEIHWRSIVKWLSIAQGSEEWSSGYRLKLEHSHEIEQITWHGKGDYFAVVMPQARNTSVAINQLTKRKSQLPFRRSKMTYQRVEFHPKKAQLFAADDKVVTIYNLLTQETIKKLTTGHKSTSCIAIHPKGDNLLLGSYEPRLTWFDTDLSTKPYKIMRYHKGGIRSVCYHKCYPLFASASDDGHVIISHGMVYDDLLQNALIVPLKMLHGHEHSETLAVSDCIFHPSHPWLFSCGADGTIRLFN
ncbi:Ribosome biogenesis protein bop1-B, partial [Fragariocoptes setiger]